MKETKEHAQKRGKKSRAAGKAFELRVRHHLEGQGWIVDKWSNQVEFFFEDESIPNVKIIEGRLIPAKHKFNYFTKAMTVGHGFPDFVAYREIKMERIPGLISCSRHYEVIGVESKMDGKLDKEERKKCDWLLEKNIFSKILIASKGEKRGVINYEVYKTI